MKPGHCLCDAPLPLHLWKHAEQLRHICSCERVWRFVAGSPVHCEGEREHNPAMTDVLDQLPPTWRDQFLIVREVPGRGICAVQRFMFTCGLLTELTFTEWTYDFSARYCFDSPTEALRALVSWDGVGDPPGEWIKEKVSGRPGPGDRRADHA